MVKSAPRSLKRIIRSLLHPLLRNYTYTVRHGLAKGYRRRGGLGFIPQFKPFTPEEAFLHKLELTGKVVYDVGGCIGTFALFFARKVGPTGRVIVFEPNPVNYETIVENIALNQVPNITVHQIALGRAKSHATLAYIPAEIGRGSIMPGTVDAVAHSKASRTVEVEVDSMDEFIRAHGLPQPQMVKIDVEGAEGDVLIGMSDVLQRSHPDIFLEVHGIDQAQQQQILELLTHHGYSLFSVEQASSVAPDAGSLPPGRYFCS